jgi:hypothetical protein
MFFFFGEFRIHIHAWDEEQLEEEEEAAAAASLLRESRQYNS